MGVKSYSYLQHIHKHLMADDLNILFDDLKKKSKQNIRLTFKNYC